MSKDHSAVGTRHARVCEGEDMDPSRVGQISWCQAVLVLSRPLGQKPVHSHIISRDSESREKGRRYCCEGAEKGQTWRVGVHTGSRSVVN
jgi:hypothetical protein